MKYHNAEDLVEKVVEAVKSLAASIFLSSIIIAVAIYMAG